MERLLRVLNDPFFKFSLKEMVCPHTYDRYIVQLGWSELQVWSWFDIRALETMLFFRKELGRTISVNNWEHGGRFSQRGMRCHLCSIVKKKTTAYQSPHPFAEGFDFDVMGMTAEEVRLWGETNSERLPHPIRFEDKKTWVHMDIRIFRPAGYENYKVYRLTV